eukprot:COSAG06_NODE_8393_length_2187_cov_34.717912_2_plen_102_part_01
MLRTIFRRARLEYAESLLRDRVDRLQWPPLVAAFFRAFALKLELLNTINQTHAVYNTLRADRYERTQSELDLAGAPDGARHGDSPAANRLGRKDDRWAYSVD